jgi:hypothetical protein
MAHNTHIPWTLLSSHLKFTPTSTAHHGQTDLHPRFLPLQGGQITHFTKIFAKAITSFSTTERSKHPSPTPIPSIDEVVISDAVAKKIEKTVSHYRYSNPRFVGRKTCRYKCWRDACYCPLSLPERIMRFWVEDLDCERTERCGSCCCYANPHSDVLELTKTLLLYGEIETLLKITAHSEVHFQKKWNIPWACGGGWGIAELMRCTLLSYVFLNVTYLHTETWEPDAKKEFIEKKRKMGSAYTEEEVDYRNSTAWNKVVSRCTGYRQYDVHTFPHRLFYG